MRKRERIALYRKLAKEFEDRKQPHGLCYAFSNYYPYSLIKKFPELLNVWFKTPEDNNNKGIYAGFNSFKRDFGYDKNKMDDFRATLLYLAALQ